MLCKKAATPKTFVTPKWLPSTHQVMEWMGSSHELEALDWPPVPLASYLALLIGIGGGGINDCRTV